MTRATEVQIVIMNKGMERGMIALMQELFERIAECEANVRDIGLIQLQATTQLAQVVDGAGAMRQQVEQIKRIVRGSADDDLPPLAS
jgi:hypothetical protein